MARDRKMLERAIDTTILAVYGTSELLHCLNFMKFDEEIPRGTLSFPK